MNIRTSFWNGNGTGESSGGWQQRGVARKAHLCLFVLLCMLPPNYGCGRSDAPDQSELSKANLPATPKPKSSDARVPLDDEVRPLIPVGTVKVSIMDLFAPDRMNKITQAMKDAMAKDPEWAMEHLKKTAKPGEPLPYDERLGISKEDYSYFRAAPNELTMKEVGHAILICKDLGEGRFEFDGGATLSPLTGIQIDLKNDVMITSNGRASPRSRIAAKPEQRSTGPWSGVQWKVRSFDPNSMRGVMEKLAVGRLQKSGKGILYYDFSEPLADRNRRISIILTYELESN